MWWLKYFRTQIRCYSTALPTIFALSSGQGKCGVAVIRVSGPKAQEAITKMTNCTALPKPRMATLHHIKDPETLEELDKGLVIWFPGPKSFTGEDSCEFQVHGGPAVIRSILNGLTKLPNFRPAEAGDFTKRAFFAGKLDLTEVEGLGDLIHAETDIQRKQALYQMEGNLSNIYQQWRSVLLKSLAHVEAFIDFSEDENMEDNILHKVNIGLHELQREISIHLNDGRKGERLREGIQTVIIGEPNAGKSSLLNILCQRPAAIVTSFPGTTRDIIETNLNINGFPVILKDTAGLRENTLDIIEKEGILRAHNTIKRADLVLLIIDAMKVSNSLISNKNTNLENFILKHLKQLNLNAQMKNLQKDLTVPLIPQYYCLFNKIDLLTEIQKTNLMKTITSNYNINCISCKTEEGIQLFIKDLTKSLHGLCGNPSKQNPSLTQSRHRYHLRECSNFLNDYFMHINEDITLAAQKLRISARHLGKIIGIVGSEEVLDVIFKDFCIGK